MRILIAGATGLVGSALVRFLSATGHEVHRLVRGAAHENSDIPWDPAHRGVARSSLERFDAAVCLSGAGIADERWSPRRKETIRSSRVDTVHFLAESLASCADRPECFVCASATGYYGTDRGAEVLSEDSPAGRGFLAKICGEWEESTQPAKTAGIRVVNLRFGIVLSGQGGALKKMLPPFRAGLGGRLGSGQQFVSWISLDDAVGAIDFGIQTEDVVGPVNAVSPRPVTNAEFARALGHALHRPAVVPVPAFVLRAALGEMSGLLLGSIRAFPRALEAHGFQFRHPTIDAALQAALFE